jgi:hypothetical protein
MKNLILFTFLIVSLASTAQIMFQKTYGGAGADVGYSIQQTPDGGFIIAGQTDSYGAGSEDVYLVKTDANGNINWSRTYGGISYDDGYSVSITNDGGYIIAGVTVNFGAGFAEAYVIKTDANGNTAWTKTYGGPGTWEDAVAVHQSSDGGYIIVGHTTSYGAGDRDVYLIKTNANGDTTWTRTFGDTLYERCYAVAECNDGGFILTGHTTSYGAGMQDLYLIKTDTNGNAMWTKTYGGSDWDEGWDVRQTSDSGFIITGFTASFGAGDRDVYMIRTDVNGDTLWTKAYGGINRDEGFCVRETNDGGYIITGTTNSFGAGNYDAYLMKTDGNGTLLWSKAYGSNAMDEGFYVQQCTDGGYAVVGFITGSSPGSWNIYLIKTDGFGNSGCNEISPVTISSNTQTQITSPPTIVSSGGVVTNAATLGGSGATMTLLCMTSSNNSESYSEQEIDIFPNPFYNHTTIQFSNPLQERHKFELFDIHGKLFMTINGIHSNRIEIERNNLPAGLYFFQLSNKNAIVAKGKLAIAN